VPARFSVFARSNTGIVGSKRTKVMDVCVYSVFALGSGVAPDWSPTQGVLPTVLLQAGATGIEEEQSVRRLVMGWTTEGSEFRVGSRIVSTPRRPDRLWVPPSLLSNEYRGLFLRKQSCRGVRLVTHLQLLPRPRKHGSIHPLPHTPSWRSA
jgi:hypothetical protein